MKVWSRNDIFDRNLYLESVTACEQLSKHCTILVLFSNNGIWMHLSNLLVIKMLGKKWFIIIIYELLHNKNHFKNVKYSKI